MNVINTPAPDLGKRRSELFQSGSEFSPVDKKDIVGIDNILLEVDQYIHWLEHSDKYSEYDSRLEPGLILEGTPGVGKTLVARYIASRSRALFINVREFPHEGNLFTDSDISNLFKRARERYAETKLPVVLFWDEFENAALERHEATPEQVSVVSQLTAELDGIHGKNDGVILIGCTNYAYRIDEALKRSGRMGVHIEFHPPDRDGKRKLLKHYLAKYAIEGGIDIETLSYFFESSANAADIEEACMEAWRFAIQRSIEGGKDPSLAQEDLIKVFLKRLVGPPTSFINLPVADRERVAVHECGHALSAIIYDIPLRLITVQPGKRSLGRCMTFEIQEHISTVDEMISQIRVNLGSLAAEYTADLPSMVGSTQDIFTANTIAAKLVDRLNVGGTTGLMNQEAVTENRSERGGFSPAISEDTVSRSDGDIKRILNQVHREAVGALHLVGKERLFEIAREVNERTTLTGEEFKELAAKVLGTDDFTKFQAKDDSVVIPANVPWESPPAVQPWAEPKRKTSSPTQR